MGVWGALGGKKCPRFIFSHLVQRETRGGRVLFFLALALTALSGYWSGALMQTCQINFAGREGCDCCKIAIPSKRWGEEMEGWARHERWGVHEFLLYKWEAGPPIFFFFYSSHCPLLLTVFLFSHERFLWLSEQLHVLYDIKCGAQIILEQNCRNVCFLKIYSQIFLFNLFLHPKL